MKLFPRHDLDELDADEPVFLIRGRDLEGPGLLRKYAFLLRARHPRALQLADEIEAFAEEVFAWQHAEGNGAPPPLDDAPIDEDDGTAPPAAPEEPPAEEGDVVESPRSPVADLAVGSGRGKGPK